MSLYGCIQAVLDEPASFLIAVSLGQVVPHPPQPRLLVEVPRLQMGKFKGVLLLLLSFLGRRGVLSVRQLAARAAGEGVELRTLEPP